MPVRFDKNGKPIGLPFRCRHVRVSATLSGIIYCVDCLEPIDDGSYYIQHC